MQREFAPRELSLALIKGNEMRTGTFTTDSRTFTYESQMVEGDVQYAENRMTIRENGNIVARFSECMSDQQIIQMYKAEIEEVGYVSDQSDIPEGDIDHYQEDRQAYESEKLERCKPSEY